MFIKKRLHHASLSLKTAVTIAALCAAAAPVRAQPEESYAQLTQLAKQWTEFEHPRITNCQADYSAGAMAEKAAKLPGYMARLEAIDRTGWSTARTVDYRLLKAAMNGLKFDLEVLRPWARDPAFYATLWAEQSDVPEHEGPNAYPTLDLFKYRFPLSAADQKELTCRIGAIPGFLAQAKTNLQDSNARDLWVYGISNFEGQAKALADLEQGALHMRTLEGHIPASLKGASPALKKAVRAAREATESFIAWLKAEAPSKTGPSGVGKENYSWYAKNVHLVPYDWQEQVTLLRRELERSWASFKIEQYRNRGLPPMTPVNSPEEWRALAKDRLKKITDFLIDGGIIEDKPYYRDAMAQQMGGYTPAEKRDFFAHSTAVEPLGLYSHQYHWVELARIKHQPNPNPLRSLNLLSNIFDSRSEGLATAMEEVLMHAGMYKDDPRGREVVWILLANRAARGLASLYVQANEMDLLEAGRFHASWTPHGWSDPESELVAFEQLLYLRQPGYGTSYITGKLLFDRLIADYAHEREAKGEPFSLPALFAKMNASDTIPFPLISREMVSEPLKIGARPAQP